MAGGAGASGRAFSSRRPVFPGVARQRDAAHHGRLAGRGRRRRHVHRGRLRHREHGPPPRSAEGVAAGELQVVRAKGGVVPAAPGSSRAPVRNRPRPGWSSSARRRYARDTATAGSAGDTSAKASRLRSYMWRESRPRRSRRANRPAARPSPSRSPSAPGASLSRNVAKLTLSFLSSHGTKTDCVSVTSWWSRSIVSLTAKPPRSFSSIGISIRAGDSPATSVRRSTRRPVAVRSRSTAAGPASPEAASSRAVPPTGTEGSCARRSTASASGVFAAGHDEIARHLELGAELVPGLVQEPIGAGRKARDRDPGLALRVVRGLAARHLGAVFPATPGPGPARSGLPARPQGVPGRPIAARAVRPSGSGGSSAGRSAVSGCCEPDQAPGALARPRHAVEVRADDRHLAPARRPAGRRRGSSIRASTATNPSRNVASRGPRLAALVRGVGRDGVGIGRPLFPSRQPLVGLRRERDRESAVGLSSAEVPVAIVSVRTVRPGSAPPEPPGELRRPRDAPAHAARGRPAGRSSSAPRR